MSTLEEKQLFQMLIPPLEHPKIVLRDTRAQNFDTYIRWRVPGTAWKVWDAPWEPMAPLLEDEREKWVRSARVRGEANPRTHLEIETLGGVHIGFVIAYWTED